jgi:hypothetical protein
MRGAAACASLQSLVIVAGRAESVKPDSQKCWLRSVARNSANTRSRNTPAGPCQVEKAESTLIRAMNAMFPTVFQANDTQVVAYGWLLSFVGFVAYLNDNEIGDC